MKKIAIFIDSMGYGGAQRVISVLCQELIKEYQVDILMLYKREIKYSLPDQVNIYFVEDMPIASTYGKLVRLLFEKWNYFRKRVYIPILRRIGIKNYAKWNETRFYMYSQFAVPYREYLCRSNANVAVGFLIRSNIAMTMAAKGTQVRTVFCERNSPVRTDFPASLIRLRDSLYRKTDSAVFQTIEQMDYYPSIHGKRSVIPNPVKDGLPERYEGTRKCSIVNFCRLSAQKNIPLLIDAFSDLIEIYPEYTLYLYGEGEEKDNLLEYIRKKQLEGKVIIKNFCSDIHERIIDAAMYVSTSDFEGLSNSMIEAMAIGLPCICTDCDGGGARMVIRDHENGLLVPKGNADAVCHAMQEIIEKPDLAKRLSEEAYKIRDELSTDKIVKKWMEVIR